MKFQERLNKKMNESKREKYTLSEWLLGLLFWLLFFYLVSFLTSCSYLIMSNQSKTMRSINKLKKPVILVSKGKNGDNTVFNLKDGNGSIFEFEGNNFQSHSIGDTIIYKQK